MSQMNYDPIERIYFSDKNACVFQFDEYGKERPAHVWRAMVLQFIDRCTREARAILKYKTVRCIECKRLVNMQAVNEGLKRILADKIRAKSDAATKFDPRGKPFSHFDSWKTGRPMVAPKETN